MSLDGKTKSLACPRCGYDQAGAQATWADAPAWPLRGRCSECGLEFAWADVMDPDRGRLGWLYEHGGMLSFRRVWATWLRAIVPGVLWRHVRLETAVVVRRLVVWPLALVLLPHLVSVAAHGVGLWQMHRGMAAAAAAWWRPGGVNWTVEVIDALVTPYLTLQETRPGTYVIESPLRFMPYAITGPLAAAPLVPVMLLILSQSRAVARVRPGHILRAGVYQLAIFAAFPVLYAFEAAWDTTLGGLGMPWRPSPLASLLGSLLPLVAAAMACWFGWYWYQAIVRGLRLPRGELVWALLMVAAGLLGTITALQDDRLWRLLGWWG